MTAPNDLVREFAPDVNRGVSSQIARLRRQTGPGAIFDPAMGTPYRSSTSPSAPVPATAWPCYRVTGSTAGLVGMAEQQTSRL